MRPGSRTLEAPRGNRYAPARGMRLMMMMIDWTMSHCSSSRSSLDSDNLTSVDGSSPIKFMPTTQHFSHPMPQSGHSAFVAFDLAVATMGLRTSWIKTKVRNMGSEPPAFSVDVANERVESGTRFTYLVNDLDSSGYCTPEILRRIGIASTVFGRLDSVWKLSLIHI